MSTGSAYLTVSGIDIDVTYKDIKNLHIGVYPPLGRVRVSAPLGLDDDNVRLAVVQRLPWINRQRERFLSAERQSEREMVSGESHFVWGIRHRLKVIERPGRPDLEIDRGRLLLHVPPGCDTLSMRDLLAAWHRQLLRGRVTELLLKWEPRVGRTVSRWSIRRMKTKWGSCNRETGHVWFNLALATKHPDCLEYIVVHEMAHLAERTHGEGFTQLMDKLLPDWRARRDMLNGAPLAHEEWRS
jgi:hypothetical protein